jgi:sulfatase maturation enzyme AslB (radical SAM superfamily)
MEKSFMLHVQGKSKLKIDVLELHISHACNLNCKYCTHFSNYDHKGLISASQADKWLNSWSHRLSPERFSIMGGEPTINPELCDILKISRKHFFNNSIHLLSNGFFLDRHPELKQVLIDNEIFLKVSLHAERGLYKEYDKKIDSIESMLNEWNVRWKFSPSHKKWRQNYQGFGKEMKPFTDNDPKASWDCCFQRTCHQLHEGKIWKCPHIAYLKMQYEKYKLSDDWIPYLDYTPLEPSCNRKELLEFFSKEEEHICSMCPASIRWVDKGNPLVRIDL